MDRAVFRRRAGRRFDPTRVLGSPPHIVGAGASSSIKSSLNVQARTAEVLTKYKTPAKTITSFRWNAQEDPTLGATLDIQDRIRVEYQGLVQDSLIAGIKHDLSGDRWLMGLTLGKS